MKIAVLNDTYKGSATTGGGHFGCEMVMEVIYSLLHANGHEIVQRVGSDETSFKLDSSADLVLVNGEGSLHHGRRRELIEVAKQAPSILVNTVWQDNPTEGLEHFRYISVREGMSHLALGGCGDVIPDVIFANARLKTYKGTEKTTEQATTDNVLSQGDGDILAIQPAHIVLDQLSRCNRVVCGRFHAAACCMALGIPFSAWPSNTHKTFGMMVDAGIHKHYYNSREKAITFCPAEVGVGVEQYVQNAISSIHRLFGRLEEWA